MARKLVTIQRIAEINEIPGADTIDVASVLGWKIVVKKGEFKVNDLICYFEVDSLLPIKPEFEFLRKGCYKKFPDGTEAFRLKTIRLRGQISQGLIMPIEILKNVVNDITNSKGFDFLVKGDAYFEEGEDVTELLGVEKYLPQIPANMTGLIKGSFPSFMLKTDETRIQVLQDVLARHKGTKCYVTEKIDGASVTYYFKDGEFGVCSRNLELKETEDNLFWKVARQQGIEGKLKCLGKNTTIQGELCGLGVQKNNLKLDRNTVLFFNAFDIDTFRYYNFDDFSLVMNTLCLETVPILETDYMLDDNIEGLIEKSKGFSKLNSKVFREGIVIRPVEEKFDLQMSAGFGNGRVSFKVVNSDYLLKYEE